MTLLAVWPWPGHLTFLNLGLLTYNIGMILPTNRAVGKIKGDNLSKMLNKASSPGETCLVNGSGYWQSDLSCSPFSLGPNLIHNIG